MKKLFVSAVFAPLALFAATDVLTPLPAGRWR